MGCVAHPRRYVDWMFILFWNFIESHLSVVDFRENFAKFRSSLFLVETMEKLIDIQMYISNSLLPVKYLTNDEEVKKQIQWYKDRGLPVPIGGNFNGVSLKTIIVY